MANERGYGFRVARYKGGAESGILPLEFDVADAYQGVADGNNIDIRRGDLMRRLANGTVEHADGNEATSQAALIVVHGVTQYYDGTQVKKGETVPGGSTGAGARDKRTVIQGIPVKDALWYLEVDDETAYTTLATYNALRGSNVEWTADGLNSKQNPKVDISEVATTESLPLRIVDVGVRPGTRDYSAAGVSLIVEFNDTQAAGQAATAVVGV